MPAQVLPHSGDTRRLGRALAVALLLESSRALRAHLDHAAAGAEPPP